MTYKIFSPRAKILLIIGVCLLLASTFFTFNQSQTTTTLPTTFWKVTAIDTMKYSRDRAQDQDTFLKIPQYVKEIAALHPTYIAIDTPYDEEFYPVLSAWVNEARRDHLHVWFRGNFSGWEGWFGYDKFTDPTVHHAMTKQFILAHSELFQNGDIFSPLPEPENGVLGDPRQNGKADEFNTFLQTSYANCTETFASIKKSVDCGYFSVNGDIAKQILTQETVSKTGNRVVIDHYIDTPQKMTDDIDFLHAKFPHAKIVLGEFGAPIPDITGDMNDQQQAEFVNKLLQVFVAKKAIIEGMNYWTFLGSTTALFTDSNEPKPVATTLAQYYKPLVVSGKVIDATEKGIEGVLLKDKNGQLLTTTDASGNYAFATLPNTVNQLTFVKNNYTRSTEQVSIATQNQKVADVTLQASHMSLLERIKVFFIKIFKK